MNYECGYCHKHFVRESSFMKHKCEQMKRAEEIITPIGQAAYLYYGKWMRSKKRKVPDIKVFMTSRYYTTFINFAKFVKAVNMVDVDTFIRLTKDKDIQPSLWRDDDIYVMYLDYLERHTDPMSRIELMVEELQDLAEELE